MISKYHITPVKLARNGCFLWHLPHLCRTHPLQLHPAVLHPKSVELTNDKLVAESDLKRTLGQLRSVPGLLNPTPPKP